MKSIAYLVSPWLFNLAVCLFLLELDFIRSNNEVSLPISTDFQRFSNQFDVLFYPKMMSQKEHTASPKKFPVYF